LVLNSSGTAAFRNNFILPSIGLKIKKNLDRIRS